MCDLRIPYYTSISSTVPLYTHPLNCKFYIESVLLLMSLHLLSRIIFITLSVSLSPTPAPPTEQLEVGRGRLSLRMVLGLFPFLVSCRGLCCQEVSCHCHCHVSHPLCTTFTKYSFKCLSFVWSPCAGCADKRERKSLCYVPAKRKAQLHYRLQRSAKRWSLGCVNMHPRPDGAVKHDSRNLGPTF